MSGGFMEIDLSPESKDPCKELMISYLKCAKDKSKEEKKSQCFHFGSDYLDCKVNPKKFAARKKTA